MSKIFKSCVFCLFADKFRNHRNQCSFVKEGGCSRALLVLNSVVKYFRLKGTNVFCCSPDATKAFDTLNHFYSLLCLIDKGFKGIANLFTSWYKNLQAYVKCGNHALSTCFTILLGKVVCSMKNF